MEKFIPIIQNYIQDYGSLGVFVASIIEELIPPIPSAAVQGLGGVLLMLNEPFSLFGLGKLVLIVSIPAAVGVCVGSLPYVYLAKKYGVEIIEKYGKYLGTSVSDLEKLESRFENSNADELVFVALRAFPAVPSIVLAVYSGMIGMSVWKYNFLSFVGVLIRATILGTIGWLAGAAFLKNLSFFIETIEKIVLVAIVGTILYMFYKNYLKHLLKK